MKIYFEEIESAKQSNLPILTTHKRLLLTEYPNHHTYIIDEDIFKYLFENNTVPMEDVIELGNHMSDSSEIKEVIKTLKSVDINEIMKSESLFKNLEKETIEKIENEVASRQLKVKGPIIGFIKSDYYLIHPKNWIKPDGEKAISFIKQHHLPTDKKIIVLSATASEFMYRRIFTDVTFHNLSKVKIAGALIQVYDKSFSREWIKLSENKRYIQSINEKLIDHKVITYKKSKKMFGNPADLYLESAEGFDQYKGENLAVVGTPHLPVPVYALIAKAIGIEFSKEHLEMKQLRVEHNGITFDFFTFEHNELREIQFSIIESSLIQAVGRARAIREAVVVYLFSNFPLQGFEKIKFEDFRSNNINTSDTSTTSSGSQAA